MHYDLKSAFIHYGRSDEKKWRDLPHVFLANLNLNSETVLMFEKTFGPICGPRYAARRNSLEEGKVGQEDRVINDGDLAEAKKRQHVLRKAWEGDARQLERMWSGFPNVQGDSGTHGPVVALDALFDKKAIHLCTESMWDFIRLAFQRDCLEGKTRVCANPDCPSPYFITVRKARGKPRQYCGKRCLALVNVRRFREREKELASKKVVTRKRR